MNSRCLVRGSSNSKSQPFFITSTGKKGFCLRMPSPQADIVSVTFYSDGVVELGARCPNCRATNIHTVAHAVKKTPAGGRLVDFSKLGTRHCDHLQDRGCCCDYDLYVPPITFSSVTREVEVIPATTGAAVLQK